MQAAGSLVVALIAHGQDHEISWPFVTLSSFQERATTVRDLSGILYLGYNPLVTHEKRLAWENYTMNHPDAQWYEEGREYQKTIGIDDLDNRPQVKTDDPNLILVDGVANYIYDFRRDDGGKGVISPEEDWYLPIWMVSDGLCESSFSSVETLTSLSFFIDVPHYSTRHGESKSCEQLSRSRRLHEM